MKFFLIFSMCLVLSVNNVENYSNQNRKWGFFAHEKINEYAVYSLPSPLRDYYLKDISQLSGKATLPDKRRYIIEEEGPRHFIDIDKYDSAVLFPRPIPFDSLQVYYTSGVIQDQGTLPWNLRKLKYLLTKAFVENDHTNIIRLSAETGHYLSDANVPLHTTSNYNGQKTGQTGIHGLWESRIVELNFSDYQLFIGPVKYEEDLDGLIWYLIREAHRHVDTVLKMEREISQNIPNGLKYTYEKRKSSVIRTYSRYFSNQYHSSLNGMVEKQLRRSIWLTATFWYSCWVEAGMPQLTG